MSNKLILTTLLVSYFFTTAYAVQVDKTKDLSTSETKNAPLVFEGLTDLSLEQLMQVNVTSATLTEENLQSVPASMTLFTRTQIQQLGINTLEELMNHVPGYQNYTSDTNQSSYSSRSRRIASGAREVLILLDGQRLNNDLFGNVGAIQPLSLKNVARVEFLRGPGSAIYGANAFLGVINVVTANSINEVDISTGSFEQRQASMNVSGVMGNLHSDLSIETHQSDGEELSIYDPIFASFIDSQQETKQQSIYWRARWENESGGGLSLQARRVDNTSDGGYFSGRASDTYNRFDFGGSFLALKYQHVLNENWEFSSRISESLYEYNATFLAAKTPSDVLVIGRFTLEGNDRTIENQLRWQQGTAKALLGFDYTRNSMDKVDSSAQFLPNPPNAPGPAFGSDTRNVKAWYGQWQDELIENWSYVLGIRKDDFSDAGGQTSPRLGLIWQADASNTLKILYGEAFRAPARNETSSTNPSQLGNPNLKPEVSKTFELVWTKTSKHHYSSISLFDTKITEAIEYDTLSQTPTFINRGEQHMSGIEAEWQWSFADNWQLRTHFSHLFNSPLTVNPDGEDLASASLIYDTGEFTTSFSGRYHGTSHDENSSEAGFKEFGGYSVLEGHAHYQFSPQVQLYVNLRNITDKKYVSPAVQSPNNFFGVPGEGRKIEVGVRWYFK